VPPDQRIAELGQLLAVARRIAAHAAGLGEQLRHSRLDALTGLVEQPDLAPRAKEPVVQLRQHFLVEPLAAALQSLQVATELRVCAGAVAVPDQIIVRGGRDAEAGHGGQRRLGQALGLRHRIGRGHVSGNHERHRVSA
jgi:hypothetical protein